MVAFIAVSQTALFIAKRDFFLSIYLFLKTIELFPVITQHVACETMLKKVFKNKHFEQYMYFIKPKVALCQCVDFKPAMDSTKALRMCLHKQLDQKE